MALAAATHWEVSATGSDGNAGVDTNSGGFNPANANFDATLTTTANTGNTATPEVSTANYTFVAGDGSHWVFMTGSGSWTLPNVTYNGQAVTPTGLLAKITSISGGKATLDAAIGHVLCYGVGGFFAVNTVAGVSTQATPTSGKWSVDYSQCGTCPFPFTDLAILSTTTFSSSAMPVGQNMVGNILLLSNANGSGATLKCYEVVSVSGTTGTVDSTFGTASGSNLTASLGGCLLTLGQAGKNHVGGNKIWLKYNASVYSQTSATSNVAAGLCTLATGVAALKTRISGYNTYRTDAPTDTGRPTLQLNVASASIITLTADSECEYLILDGNAQTSSRGVGGPSPLSSVAYYISAKTFKNAAFFAITTLFCDATACSLVGVFNGCNAFYCVAWSNTFTGFLSGSAAEVWESCLSINNTGANSYGFSNPDAQSVLAHNCTAFGNGSDNFRLYVTVGTQCVVMNCISYGALGTGKGFGANATPTDQPSFWNCAAGGNGGVNWDTNYSKANQHGNITLTANPFNNTGNGDFGLNTTAGGGAACRAAGIISVFPGLNAVNFTTGTTTNVDLGGVQHAAGNTNILCPPPPLVALTWDFMDRG